MRILFVVQRYGAEVFGGAEAHCREFATRMAVRGHDVQVVTSCAVSYVDWADHYAPGESEIDGVRVHRLAVTRARDHVFAGLQARVLPTRPWVGAHLQREWMRQQGPWVAQLAPWLEEHSRQVDVTVFFTYLYYTTWAGLSATRSASVLHPTAHDEPPAYLPIYDQMYRLPTVLACSTQEEAAFVQRRYRLRRPQQVIGIGIRLDPGGDENAFRAAHGLAERPYIACVGRTDPGKGSVELFEFFTAYKRRNPGALALALIGEEVHPLGEHPDVVKTGFVGEAARDGGVRGALALVQPSFYESFSMVLCEAWACGVPALVQGRCDVLVGQARRSGGGLPYSGYAEFEAALDLLQSDGDLRHRLGEAGRDHVRRNYDWDVVLDRYERVLALATDRRWVPFRVAG